MKTKLPTFVDKHTNSQKSYVENRTRKYTQVSQDED